LAGVCFGLFGGTLIGASGGVLGLMVACAILFPQFVVILLIFPVPIRFAVVLFTGIYLMSVLKEVFQPGSSLNAGGDLCHLGGMATGFVWVMSRGYFAGFVGRKRRGAFQRKLEDDRQQQYEVDRILAKVHETGIGSLSRREKQVLQKATQNQRHKTGS
ncbi:MAG: rhomboid family intramembrane serine protease, partial [Planctomycetes bacterium]|nr:rhomboid family intramembrane serine protease [Planctomycetota bacterium]